MLPELTGQGIKMEIIKFLTPEEFLARIGTDKGFKDIIGNEDHYEEGNPKYDVYYNILPLKWKEEMNLYFL